jgi:SAM-dependent methyltransferase
MFGQNEAMDRYRDWYNRTIATGRDSFGKFEYHLQEQLRRLSPVGKRILEVGCGKGALSLYLSLFSGAERVAALDESAGVGSESGITKCLRDAALFFETTNLDVVEVDIMANNFLDGDFDIIIANNALHHVVDSGLLSSHNWAHREYVRLFQELGRLLASGGILSISESSRASFWRWSPVKLKWRNIDWELHPTRAEWLSVIRQAGLEVRSCEYTVPCALRQLKPFLTNPVLQFMLYPSFVITAQR